MTKKQVNKQSVKPITAWAIEINGKLNGYNVFGSRRLARMFRNDCINPFLKDVYGDIKSVHVRKIQISVIPGR